MALSAPSNVTTKGEDDEWNGQNDNKIEDACVAEDYYLSTIAEAKQY
jgi:hypothetical protein